jgi:SAM-dependent methyltransferase
MLRALHKLFDLPLVFNTYQVVADGGKGRQIRRFLEDLPFESVLDVGCGTGNWAGTARGRYVGVDAAPEFIEDARKRYRGETAKTFLLLDPTREDVPGNFDLAQLISVLHHLSDPEIVRLLARISRQVRYLFILDLYPMPWNPIARILYAADRGDYIRNPEEQKRVIVQNSSMRLLKDGSYVAPTGLYRHTLLLFENGIA